MMCTKLTTILSHPEELGPSMLDVKYEGLGGTCLVTTPLNMAPNLSECNVSHGGIALKVYGHWRRMKKEHIVRIMLNVDIPGKRRNGGQTREMERCV